MPPPPKDYPPQEPQDLKGVLRIPLSVLGISGGASFVPVTTVGTDGEVLLPSGASSLVRFDAIQPPLGYTPTNGLIRIKIRFPFIQSPEFVNFNVYATFVGASPTGATQQTEAHAVVVDTSLAQFTSGNAFWDYEISTPFTTSPATIASVASSLGIQETDLRFFVVLERANDGSLSQAELNSATLELDL